MYEFILLCLMASLSIALLVLLVFWIKNEFAFRSRIDIIMAIRDYQIECVYTGETELVDYADMESYDDTMRRFWDFGCTRILPKEKFEIIKPYIKKGENVE